MRRRCNPTTRIFLFIAERKSFAFPQVSPQQPYAKGVLEISPMRSVGVTIREKSARQRRAAFYAVGFPHAFSVQAFLGLLPDASHRANFR